MEQKEYFLVEGATKVILKEYRSVEHMLKDIPFKDPSCFFIGELPSRKSYTIDEIIEMYQ